MGHFRRCYGLRNRGWDVFGCDNELYGWVALDLSYVFSRARLRGLVRSDVEAILGVVLRPREPAAMLEFKGPSNYSSKGKRNRDFRDAD